MNKDFCDGKRNCFDSSDEICYKKEKLIFRYGSKKKIMKK